MFSDWNIRHEAACLSVCPLGHSASVCCPCLKWYPSLSCLGWMVSGVFTLTVSSPTSECRSHCECSSAHIPAGKGGSGVRWMLTAVALTVYLDFGWGNSILHTQQQDTQDWWPMCRTDTCKHLFCTYLQRTWSSCGGVNVSLRPLLFSKVCTFIQQNEKTTLSPVFTV